MSKMLQDFLNAQATLMNPTTVACPANKNIVRPDKKKKVIVPTEDTDEMFNFIIEKKPANKKVMKFIQNCINDILDDDA